MSNSNYTNIIILRGKILPFLCSYRIHLGYDLNAHSLYIMSSSNYINIIILRGKMLPFLCSYRIHLGYDLNAHSLDIPTGRKEERNSLATTHSIFPIINPVYTFNKENSPNWITIIQLNGRVVKYNMNSLDHIIITITHKSQAGYNTTTTKSYNI